MSRFLGAVCAAALLAAVLPGAALPGAASAEVQPKADLPSVEQSLAFVGQLGEAVNVQVAAMKKLLEAKPLFDSMTSPAAVKGAAPRARVAISEARRSVEQADSMLGRIVAPAGLSVGGLTPQSMIAEARSQNAQSIALLADYETFLGAAERGDHAASRRAAPKLMEASFLLVDGGATVYRNRQAAIPETQSVHQALGIGVQLYRAMSASGRAWIAAKYGGGRPESAAATLRSTLGSVAREARSASERGRANLAREIAELDRRTSGLGFQGEQAATLARIRQALASKEKLFAVGDSLAGMAEAGAKVTGAALAAQPAPELLGHLAPLELRFHGALAEQAAIAAGKIE